MSITNQPIMRDLKSGKEADKYRGKLNYRLTLTLQKSRIPQVRGVKGEEIRDEHKFIT